MARLREVRLWKERLGKAVPGGPVRGPDVTFVSWDTLPGRRGPDDPIPELAPDLVVELK